MGIEFMRKAAPKFRKGLDRKRIELATPDLFTREPSSSPRTYAAKVRNGQCLSPGEALGVRIDGNKVVALRGIDPVAVFSSPPGELIDALVASHGEACGFVREIHEIAQVAEISVC